MKRVHIVGRKNSGKTTLIVDLVRQLRASGLRVGTIKHTHHRHELDVPGKDSHRHREAGAETVAILSPALTAVYFDNDGDRGPAGYATIDHAFADCDIVLVEGDLSASAPQVEVWRKECVEPPYARERPAISAVVTDDPAPGIAHVWSRSDVPALAKRLLELVRASGA